MQIVSRECLSAMKLYLASVSFPFACSLIQLYPLKQKGIRPIRALINKISTAVAGQVANNPTGFLFVFPQNMYENFYQGKIFQDMNSFSLRSGVQGSPSIFLALHLIASVDLGQVPGAQVLYPDVELLQLLVCTFVSELCLSICHS